MVRAVIQEDCTEVCSLVKSNFPRLDTTPLRILTQSHVLLHLRIGTRLVSGVSTITTWFSFLSIFLALQTIVVSGILNLVSPTLAKTHLSNLTFLIQLSAYSVLFTLS